MANISQKLMTSLPFICMMYINSFNLNAMSNIGEINGDLFNVVPYSMSYDTQFNLMIFFCISKFTVFTKHDPSIGLVMKHTYNLI